MHKWLAAWLLVVALEVRAYGATCLGIPFPETLQATGTPLVLNGLGLRKAYVFVKVYVAGLYLPQKTNQSAQILRDDMPRTLLIRLVRDVTQKELIDAWTKGFEDNAPDLWPHLKTRIDKIKSALPPQLNEGDTFQFVYQPGKWTEIRRNGRLAIELDGTDFARALFSIYVGPKPPNESLKTGLLGGACE